MNITKKLRFFSLVIAIAVILSILPIQASAATDGENYANALSDFAMFLGIFQGTDSEYELDQGITRREASVMLVRMLGAEDKALSEVNDTPFKDLDDSAKPYVGWLYKHGLVKGITPNLFDPDSLITYQQYFVMLLRCLGYDDGSDFEYAQTREFLLSTVYKPDDEWYMYKIFDDENDVVFLRGDCVLLSLQALQWKLKNNSGYLADKLVLEGVFSEEEFVNLFKNMCDDIGLDRNGHIVWVYYNWHMSIPQLVLSSLGLSSECYIAAVSANSEIIFAVDEDGITWDVDRNTFERVRKVAEQPSVCIEWAYTLGTIGYQEQDMNRDAFYFFD